MARSLSSDLQTQVSAKATAIAFLIELNLSSVVRVTNWYQDVTYDSNLYVAGGDFVSVDQVTESGELQVNELQLKLSNITNTVRNLIITGDYIDVTANIDLAFFNSSDVFQGAINYFSGFIKSASIEESIDNSILNIVIANHWSNWNLIKGRHFTDESQQQVYSGDKGLEYSNQAKKDVRWGSD